MDGIPIFGGQVTAMIGLSNKKVVNGPVGEPLTCAGAMFACGEGESELIALIGCSGQRPIYANFVLYDRTPGYIESQSICYSWIEKRISLYMGGPHRDLWHNVWLQTVVSSQ